MDKVVYTQPGIVHAVYDSEMKGIVVTWEKLGTHHYIRPCFESLVDCIQRNGVKVIIINTTKATGVVSQEDHKWFEGFLFHKLERAELKALITVIPENAFSRLSTDHWKRIGKSFHQIEFLETDSFEKAQELAKNYV